MGKSNAFVYIQVKLPRGHSINRDYSTWAMLFAYHKFINNVLHPDSCNNLISQMLIM
jgi:hypothetical protein